MDGFEPGLKDIGPSGDDLGVSMSIQPGMVMVLIRSMVAVDPYLCDCYILSRNLYVVQW